MNLFIVATPIGNLKDISLRAIDTLKNADLILCEDTRVSIKLLNHYSIKKPLMSYQKFNEKEISDKLESLFEKYNNIALISDAGAPGFSDPGAVIVDKAYKIGANVISIPGACAFAAGYSISGILNTSFVFLGFLPRKTSEQVKLFKELETSIFSFYGFYESPLRLIKTLENLQCIQTKTICVFNDLTKLHERTYRGNISEVLNELKANENASKGEYTVLFEIENKKELPVELSLEAQILNEMVLNKISVKEAIKKLSIKYAKNDLYKAGLNIKTIIK